MDGWIDGWIDGLLCFGFLVLLPMAAKSNSSNKVGPLYQQLLSLHMSPQNQVNLILKLILTCQYSAWTLS